MLTEIRKAILGVSVVSFVAVAQLIAGNGGEARAWAVLPEAGPTPASAPAYAGYKGVAIGASTDDVRKKLGEPKDKSEGMDLYIFSESESAQFYYDAAHAVSAIMITYSGDLKSAPSPKDVFGEDVPPKEDGGVFRMARYPKAGFWISYNRTGGTDAIVSIALQKI